MKFFLAGILSIPFVLPNQEFLVSQPFACPNKLQPLVDKMLKDLPSYANRVIQRSGNSYSKSSFKFYILVAGAADYRPLPLKVQQYDDAQPDKLTQQVFFTTLERHYDRQTIKDSQNYHWLFLTFSQGEWKMVMLYTQIGSTPAQENSQGIVGQAISLWLRDCQAGALKMTKVH
jgi:hypothetical protein